MTEPPSEVELWKRKAERERRARKEAERLLEEKSSELWHSNASLELDIAERTAELVRARDEAIAAGRARTDFLARMSHEIRTPMNAVIGMAELLLMDKLEPSVAAGVQTIRSAADALLALINDILDFSKIEAGGLSLQPVEFDLDAQVSSIIELMTAPARQGGLELRVDMDRRTAGVFLGDEVRLRQVLLNLVGNAVKFTESGHVEVRTRVVDEGGDQVCVEFCVSDSGPGIPKTSQAAIFEVFEQGDGSSTRRHGGTGLGLAISRRLVELFGGELWVESEVGEGARFYFTVWLKRVRRATQAPIPGWNVLLVTEDAPTMEAMRMLLRPSGGSAIGVNEGLAAVAQLANAAASGRGFDVVMMSAAEARSGAILPTLGSVPALAGVRTLVFGGQVEGVTSALEATLSPSAAASALRALANAEAKRAPGPRAPSKVEATILLVDDNPANRAITARLLEKAGHVVQTARDGGEALSAVTAGEFDLVFMDVQMPGLDGVAATERIRGWEATRGGHVPIVGLSAVTAPEELQRCRRAGMDDFLTKPIRSAALFDMVEALLEQAKHREATVPARPTIAQRLVAPEVTEAFGDDRESIQLCLEVFLASRPEYAKSLQSGLDARDTDGLRQIGHTLAGSFMGLIRPELLEQAQAVEDSAAAALEGHAAVDVAVERAQTLLEGLEALDREVRAYLESAEAQRLT